jgi:hypothetical protein
MLAYLFGSNNKKYFKVNIHKPSQYGKDICLNLFIEYTEESHDYFLNLLNNSSDYINCKMFDEEYHQKDIDNIFKYHPCINEYKAQCSIKNNDFNNSIQFIDDKFNPREIMNIKIEKEQFGIKTKFI